VLRNSNNEMFHRQGRSSQRQSNAAKKSRESAKLGERKADLLAQINEQAAGLKASKAEYKSMTGTGSRSSGSSSRKPTDDSVIVSASSCGRVKTVPPPKRGKGVWFHLQGRIALNIHNHQFSCPGDVSNTRHRQI
jgi:hypothetical protein